MSQGEQTIVASPKKERFAVQSHHQALPRPHSYENARPHHGPFQCKLSQCNWFFLARGTHVGPDVMQSGFGVNFLFGPGKF